MHVININILFLHKYMHVKYMQTYVDTNVHVL